MDDVAKIISNIDHSEIYLLIAEIPIYLFTNRETPLYRVSDTVSGNIGASDSRKFNQLSQKHIYKISNHDCP